MQNSPICLVFEFMEFGSLSDYLKKQRGNLSKEDLLGMCQDVCEGMAYLEEASVIHRDLVCLDHIWFLCKEIYNIKSQHKNEITAIYYL